MGDSDDLAQRPAVSVIETADVVVIGGGCMGASTACFLAERGVAVALVEKGYLASGPTGKSSAVIRQHYSVEQLVVTSFRSLRTFETFDDVVGGDPGFVKTGWLMLASDDYAPTLRRLVEMQRGLGVNVQLLSPAELADLQPQTSLDYVACAAYHPDSGYANPVATTNLFAARARDRGAKVYEQTQVTGIGLQGGRVHSVATSKGDISTPVVVNAAGPWGSGVGRMAGIELPITPTRHQVAVFKRPYEYWQPPMTYADEPLQAYYRPEGDDMFLMGTDNEALLQDTVDPDAYREETDQDALPWFMERLRRRFPVMERASYRGGYAGIYDTTPDQQPIIGPSTEVQGFYCLLGWSGHGFKHSPAMGRLMAELIIDGATSDVDLSAFSPARFREGRLVDAGEY